MTSRKLIAPRTGPGALVVFDLDGTLLRGATVCELLAEPIGRRSRMEELELLTLRADLLAAREEMALWYRGVERGKLLDALDHAEWAPGLARGLALLREHGVTLAIASVTWRFAVEHLARQWRIEHCLGTGLSASADIDHVWPEHKAAWVRELGDRLGIPDERCAAVGDSAGDYAMLDAVGLPIFVGAQCPACGARWRHWPAADVEQIARHLLGTWGLARI